MHTIKECKNKPVRETATAKTATLDGLVDTAITTIDYDGSDSEWYLITLNIIYYFEMILSISTKKAFMYYLLHHDLCSSKDPVEENSKNKGIGNEG